MGEFKSLVFYVLAMLCATMFFSMYKSKRKLYRKAGAFAGIMIPTLVSGFRYDVGTDYDTYNYIFSVIRQLSVGDILAEKVNLHMEKGFMFFVKLLSCIGNNKFIFGMITLCTVSIFAYTILTQYRNRNLTVVYALFLFIHYFSSLNIIRQYLAMAIVFWGMKYIFENKFLKYIIVIAMASFIHITVIVTLPMWFLWDHKRNRCIKVEKKGVIFVMALIVVMYWKQILKIVLTLNIPFLQKFIPYLEANEASNRTFYVKIFMLIVIILGMKCLKVYDERIECFVYLYAIGTIIEYVGFYIPFAKRAGLYYSFPGLIVMSLPEMMFKKNNRFIVNLFVIGIAIIYFILFAYILGQGGVIPYKVN